MVEIIVIFAVMVTILLVAAYISQKFGLGTRGGTSHATAPTVPICGVPEPPPEYCDIFMVLLECVKSNYWRIGLCLPSESPAQYCALPGQWATVQSGILMFWFMFDANTSNGLPVNAAKIAKILNERLPSFCFTAGIPLFRVVVVQPLPEGRVAIGVRWA